MFRMCDFVYTHTATHTHLHAAFIICLGKGKCECLKADIANSETLVKEKKIQKQYNGFSRFSTCLINLVAFHFIVVKKDSIKVDTRKKDYTILFNDLIF